MYSLKEITKQEPSQISAVLIAIINVIVLVGIWHASEKQILGVDTVFPLLLSLFYVRPLTASKDALTKLVNGDTPAPPA